MKKFEVHDPKFLPHCGCDLQLELPEGSALVLVGENGLGKTTLLQRLAEQLPNDFRAVVEQKSSEYFYDRKVRSLKEFFLTAELPLFDKEMFLELWKAFSLDLKEERHVSQLSGGEAQALKLTLALCKTTAFYLLDEPSQFLDKERKDVLVAILQKLLSQNKSLLMIEHNREWVPQNWQIQKLVIVNGTLMKERA